MGEGRSSIVAEYKRVYVLLHVTVVRYNPETSTFFAAAAFK